MSDLAALLDPRAVDLSATAPGRDEAIRLAGDLLVQVGAVEPGYVDTMLERERSVPTYLGEGVAIPHGTLAGKDLVHRDALSFLRFPDGVDWGGQKVEVAIGIAAAGEGHVDLLARIAQLLLDPGQAAALRAVTSYEELSRLLGTEEEGAT
ncbi:MAG TPA: PTS sugar transporter subunit IIA [Ornithinicoccus sp.]|jgi:PTS system mannitol-specific IIA component|nr:PTS sugar transporter subunit IIA [Ornithinicoccus sp.]